MELSKINEAIPVPSAAAMENAQKRWNGIAKPVGSLGLLEQAVVQIAGVRRDHNVRLDKRALVVMCADNGVVEEGVTQTGQEVTALVAGNMKKGRASVSCMAAVARADVFPVDMGMRDRAEGVLDRRIASGTRNIAREAAMAREQAEACIRAGMDIVKELKEQGYDIIATGEMGIGNTTTSSAVAAVLCGLPSEEITGRGAGLSDEGLLKKQRTIRRAISVNRPDALDALDVLSKLGGFDIAGMTGLFIGGALYGLPVLIDGFISATAALVAYRLCPACGCAMLATHSSAEPGTEAIFAELGKKPLIYAQMRLGEGTGAVCLLPLLDMALSVYHNMVSFENIGLKPYEVIPK